VLDLRRKLVLRRRCEVTEVRYRTIKLRLDSYRRRCEREKKSSVLKRVLEDEIEVLCEERERREEELSRYMSRSSSSSSSSEKLYMFDHPVLHIVLPYLDASGTVKLGSTSSTNRGT